MAKIKCKCGEVLSNRLIPNDVELKVYTDKEWDEIHSLELIDELPEPKFNVWRCYVCERLYFFEGTQLIKTYCLEKD